MRDATFDVLGIGHAIVDVLASTSDAFLTEHGIGKGTMTLVDAFRAETLGRTMKNTVEASGGSCANTMVGIASFGGSAAFIGKVDDDRLGQVFAEDIHKSGVHFDSTRSKGGAATASSHIVVTPDGQRSMNTFLGCASAITEADMTAQKIGAAKVLYVEGYLWDTPGAKAAIRTAIARAKAASRKVAFTLSDPFCVGRWRDEFKALLANDVDILFANEAEAKALYETEIFDEAFQSIRKWGKTAAITRSAHGSVVVEDWRVHILDAEPVAHVVDTTGAGDQYAAGFLFGYARGLSLDVCGRLGGIAAAEVISHMGPRPATSYKSLAAAAGLL
ncbi:MAG: adenosine kinase [Alphaproteobacteria bacterium]|nr:adenosine kinase [Alphaproteobacteria bacterium]